MKYREEVQKDPHMRATVYGYFPVWETTEKNDADFPFFAGECDVEVGRTEAPADQKPEYRRIKFNIPNVTTFALAWASLLDCAQREIDRIVAEDKRRRESLVARVLPPPIFAANAAPPNICEMINQAALQAQVQ